MNSEEVIGLERFTPLIQLWAGVCLLCFYESFMKKPPFGGQVANIKKMYEDFRLKYVDYLRNQENIDWQKFNASKWGLLKPSIINLASVSLTLSVLLLIYPGCCGYSNFDQLFRAFQFIDLIILPYSFLTLFGYRNDFLRSHWLSLCIIIFCIGLFFTFNLWGNYLSDCLYWGKTKNTIITLITLFISGGLLAFRMRYNYYIIKDQGRKLNELNNNYIFLTTKLANLNSGLDDENEKDSALSRKIDKRFAEKTKPLKNEDHINGREIYSKCIEEEIQEEYSEFIKDDGAWKEILNILLWITGICYLIKPNLKNTSCGELEHSSSINGKPQSNIDLKNQDADIKSNKESNIKDNPFSSDL